MFYIYEKSIGEEDHTALEVFRTNDEKQAFRIKNKRLRTYGIEVFIYLDDKEIWRGTSA